jgi:outer membrane protein
MRLIGAMLLIIIGFPAFAQAEDSAWLSLKDPFHTQKKLAPYGKNLKPANCPNPPDTSKPLELTEVVVATLCHNPDSRAAFLSLLAQADDYDGTIMSYLPDLRAFANLSRTRNTDNRKFHEINSSSGISASTDVLLYDFGRRETNLEIAERSLAAAGLSYDSTLQGFIASSLQAYFRLLTSQNAVGISKETLRLSNSTLEAAELRYKLGLVPLSDVLQARTSNSAAQLSLQQIENSLALDRATLAQLIGFPPLTDLSVKELDDSNILKAPFDEDIVMLIEKAKDERNDLQTRRISLKNQEDSLKLTKKRGLPTISASASSGVNDISAWDSDTVRSDSIGISVSIPIFTGFDRIFSERAQTKQLEASRENYLQSERDVEQDVLRSWQNYNTSVKSFETSFNSLAVANQLKDVALGRYKEGLGTILDVLNAQISYSSSLQSYLTSRYSLLATRVDLVRAVGTLDLTNVTPDKNIEVAPTSSIYAEPLELAPVIPEDIKYDQVQEEHH